MRVLMRLYVIYFVLILSGCVTAPIERKLGENQTPRTDSVMDISAADETAHLFLKLRPPSIQYMVSVYQVTIDGEKSFLISKHSDTDITIDAGPHMIVIQAPKFGRSSKLAFDVQKDEMVEVEYIGPYWMWSKGVLVKK